MFNELMVQYRTEYTDDKVQAGIFGALLLVDVHVEASLLMSWLIGADMNVTLSNDGPVTFMPHEQAQFELIVCR